MTRTAGNLHALWITLLGAVLLAGAVAAPASAASAWVGSEFLTDPSPLRRDTRPQDRSAEASHASMNSSGDSIVGWVQSERTWSGNSVTAQIAYVKIADRPAGGDWSAPVTVHTEASISSSGVRVARGPGGRAAAAWLQSPGGCCTAQVMVAYRDTTGAWGAGVQVGQANDSGVYQLPQLAFDAAGNLTAAWEGGSDLIMTADRPAIGTTWSTEQQIGQGEAFELAMDSAGRALIVADVADNRITRNTRAAFGAAWSTQETIHTASVAVAQPQAAIAPNGAAMVAWAEYFNFSSDTRIRAAARGALASGAGDGAWSTPFDISATNERVSLTDPPDVGIDGTGNSTVVWLQQRRSSPAQDGYLFARTRTSTGTLEDATVLQADPLGGRLATPRIVVGPTGAAIAAWKYTEPSPSELRTAHRPAGGSWGSSASRASLGVSNAFALAMDDDGNGLLGWHSRETVDGCSSCGYWVGARGFDAAGPRLTDVSIPGSGQAGSPVSFSATPVDVWSIVAGTSWNFGDTTSGMGNSVSHTYATNGTYTVTAAATDSLGNTGPSANGSITVAADVAPVVTLTGPSGEINENDVTFTFSADDAQADVECALDRPGTANDDAFADCPGGTKTYNDLPDGDYTFSVKATDTGGLVDEEAKSFTVDTGAPTTLIDDAPANPTNVQSFKFEYSSPSDGADALFECRLDSDDEADFEECEESGFSTGTLGGGQHTFDVRSVDLAGNVDATPARHTWTIDLSVPNTSVPSPPAEFGTNRRPVIGFESTEAGSSFTCRFGTPGDADAHFALRTCTGNSFQPVSDLAEGTHRFEVAAVDQAGNTDTTPTVVTFTVDVTPPGTQVDSGPDGSTNQVRPTFTFSSPGETSPAFGCRLTRQGETPAAFADCNSGSFQPAADLAEGSYTFEVLARDRAGNLDASPATRAFQVDLAAADTTPPDTLIEGGPDGRTRDRRPSFGFRAPGEPGASFECRLGPASSPGAFAPCTSPYAPASDLADGDYAFEVRAADAAGNQDASAARRTFTVETPPPHEADPAHFLPPGSLIGMDETLALAPMPDFLPKQVGKKWRFTSVEDAQTALESLDVNVSVVPKPVSAKGANRSQRAQLRESGRGGEIIKQTPLPEASLRSTASEPAEVTLEYFDPSKDSEVRDEIDDAIDDAKRKLRRDDKRPPACGLLLLKQADLNQLFSVKGLAMSPDDAKKLLKSYRCDYQFDFVKGGTEQAWVTKVAVNKKEKRLDLRAVLPFQQDFVFFLREEPSQVRKDDLSFKGTPGNQGQKDWQLTQSDTNDNVFTVQVVERMTGALVRGITVDFFAAGAKVLSKKTDDNGETTFRVRLPDVDLGANLFARFRGAEGGVMEGTRSVPVVKRNADFTTVTGRALDYAKGRYTGKAAELSEAKELPLVPANGGLGVSNTAASTPEVKEEVAVAIGNTSAGTQLIETKSNYMDLSQGNVLVGAAPGVIAAGGGNVIAAGALNKRAKRGSLQPAFFNPGAYIGGLLNGLVSTLDRAFKQGIGSLNRAVPPEVSQQVAGASSALQSKGFTPLDSVFLDPTKVGVIAAGGGNIISDKGLGVIAAGGGNVIAAGGGNVIAAGGGNVIAAGGGNLLSRSGSVIAAGGGNIISDKGLGVIAPGALNFVPVSGGLVIAAGGGNVIAPGALN